MWKYVRVSQWWLKWSFGIWIGLWIIGGFLNVFVYDSSFGDGIGCISYPWANVSWAYFSFLGITPFFALLSLAIWRSTHPHKQWMTGIPISGTYATMGISIGYLIQFTVLRLSGACFSFSMLLNGTTYDSLLGFFAIALLVCFIGMLLVLALIVSRNDTNASSLRRWLFVGMGITVISFIAFFVDGLIVSYPYKCWDYVSTPFMSAASSLAFTAFISLTITTIVAFRPQRLFLKQLMYIPLGNSILCGIGIIGALVLSAQYDRRCYPYTGSYELHYPHWIDTPMLIIGILTLLSVTGGLALVAFERSKDLSGNKE